MRVAIVSPALPPFPAGEAEFCARIAEGLAATGHEVTIVTSARAHAPLINVRTQASIPRWSWRYAPRLVRTLHGLTPDVVLIAYIGWMYDHHPMVTHLPTLLHAAGFRGRVVPLFFNAMGSRSAKATPLSLIAQRLSRLLERRRNTGFEFGTLIGRGDEVLTLSLSHAKALRPTCSNEELEHSVLPTFPLIAPSVLSREEARSRLGIDPETFFFLNFGYLYPGKGIETLLTAFRQVTREAPSAKLHFVGGTLSESFAPTASYVEELKALCREEPLASRVSWEGGFLPGAPEPGWWLAACDAAVLPFDVGIQENNSSAVAAFTAGAPVIATARAGAPVGFDLEKILTVPPQAPQALASAMCRVIAEPALRERLHVGSLELGSRFTFARCLDRLTRLLPEPHSAV